AIFSRRNIWSKVFLTEVVPAPEEPVIAMIGCLTDIFRAPSRSPPQTASAEQRRARRRTVAFEEIAAREFDFVGRAEDQRRSRMHVVEADVEDAVDAVDGEAAGLLDEQRDRIGHVE